MGLAQKEFHELTAVSAGKDQTLALLKTGGVLGWGGAGSGRITPPYVDMCSSSKDIKTTAVYVGGPALFSNISAGYGVSLGVSDQQKLLIWGFCQVGIGGKHSFSEQPTLIEGFANATKVAAGQFLYAALDQSGQVYTWGFSTDGALGRPSSQINALPGLVSLPAIKDIAIGDQFMLALSADGHLYAWGSNSAGQLGLGHLNAVSKPEAIALSSQVKQIAVGSTHVLALTSEGTVLGWGSNHFGQSGGHQAARSTKPAFIVEPTPIVFQEKIVAVAAGMHFSLALSASGKVYAWGWNGFGQLGLGDLQSRRVPTLVPGLSGVRAISAGEGHVLAIGANQLFGWGSNESGQLGDAVEKQTSPNAFLAIA
jgi:alpha-tubulin suppressor-like RCC1 family protein